MSEQPNEVKEEVAEEVKEPQTPAQEAPAPAKKKKKSKAGIIILCIVLVIVFAIAGVAIYAFTYPGGPIAIIKGKNPDQLKTAFAKINYTCEVITDVYAVKEDVLWNRIPAVAATYSEDRNTVEMRAFETYFKTYCVSENEVFYEFGIRHIETKEVVYKLVGDKTLEYTFSSEEAAQKYTGGEMKYRLYAETYDGKAVIESIKDKKFAYDWKQPSYDFIYSETKEKALSLSPVEISYKVKLNEDHSLNTLQYTEQSTGAMAMIRGVTGLSYAYTDYGTTVKPAA